MKPQSSEGLIIKQIDFHESDKIITLLTKDQGKITGVLRGAKKINSPHVGLSEPFTHVNVQYVEKPHAELVRIRKLGLLNSFYPIRLSYEKILHATYFTEWIHLCAVDSQEAPHFLICCFPDWKVCNLYEFLQKSKSSLKRAFSSCWEFGRIQTSVSSAMFNCGSFLRERFRS